MTGLNYSLSIFSLRRFSINKTNYTLEIIQQGKIVKYFFYHSN
ncbi:MAG: hypothetical protein BWZ11_00529 [Bacteroidetes bacterium ADurb.BinA395]|jgi:hypothetical protein|nr:MAG: hypothetical protein BWZ11_00529 [Bacteroidetes bacterium ADurb.BinA395]